MAAAEVLPENHIFVFGSNEKGIHGAGAARHAFDKLGAQWGVPEGITGKCYAIPTKNGKLYTLHPDVIDRYVQRFKFWAAAHPDDTFQVTQIGCGLAGLRPDQIAPLFIGSSMNCWFDLAWERYLGGSYHYWGHL